MLELKNISKDYHVGPNTIHALKNINLKFPEKGFVSVLGKSGSGKTTLLNIMGGLDNYTSGEIIINGVNTKDFSSRDWDTYRNHHIGFVFQNYSLIPHQNLLENVELAPSISGLPKDKRVKLSKDALKAVGLEDRMYQKPSQVSGGQNQRTAIARAIVTDPSIVLADEPTGSLDSKTSTQIMNILKDISKERLVIMVTHDEYLAKTYSDRIIRLKDGEVIKDTAPIDKPTEHKQKDKSNKKQASMSFFTSLGLSWRNLISNKGKSFLTAIAGSIGIIGIALVYAMSYGVNAFIRENQEATLSSYPLTIEAESIGLDSLMNDMNKLSEEAKDSSKSKNEVNSFQVMDYILDLEGAFTGVENNLEDFSKYIESDDVFINNTKSIHYDYGLDLNIYTRDNQGEIIKADLFDQIDKVVNKLNQEGELSPSDESNLANFKALSESSFIKDYSTFSELVPNSEQSDISSIMKEQYKLEAGSWPEEDDEIVLIINKYKQIPDFVLYSLGYRSQEDFERIFKQSLDDEELDSKEADKFSYEDLLDKKLRLFVPGEFYEYNEDKGYYEDIRTKEDGIDELYNSKDKGMDLKIVGIIQEDPEAEDHILDGWLAYRRELTQKLIKKNLDTPVVKAQAENKELDVLNGLDFATEENTKISDKEKADLITDHAKEQDKAEQIKYYDFLAKTMPQAELDEKVDTQLEFLDQNEKDEVVLKSLKEARDLDDEAARKQLDKLNEDKYEDILLKSIEVSIETSYANKVSQEISKLPEQTKLKLLENSEWTDDQLAKLYDEYMPPQFSKSSYEDNQEILGMDVSEPKAIYFYNNSFEEKDLIKDEIEKYNEKQTDEDNEIVFIDYVEIFMNMAQRIINIVTYALIGLVALSLIVSSIMMAIITYISVLQREKEIGVLRALGASKGNVSTVFIAECLIEGLAAGILGILFSEIFIVFINRFIKNSLEELSFSIYLPWNVSLGLILLSTILTVIAGLIPSLMAAKKDPVEALRSE